MRPDKKFSGSMPCDLLYAAEWTGYLHPETGQPTLPSLHDHRLAVIATDSG